MSQDITVTDLFCGAGGSSIGAERAGARLRMAANHWRLAVDTHNTNFPHADHDVADISQVDPRRYPRTDILIASPECTNHSIAKRQKSELTADEVAAVERSRATMWDVPRFAERHRYEIVVVENVVDAVRWEPFRAWLLAMDSLGYEHELLSLNSFVAHPTPQSRDRLYIVFHRRGNTAPDLDMRALAWCASCEREVRASQAWKERKDDDALRVGRYRAQYAYACPDCGGKALPLVYPAASAIDWTQPATRIGDRETPLAEATMERIRDGVRRFGPEAMKANADAAFEREGYYRTYPRWRKDEESAAGLLVDTLYAGSPGHIGPLAGAAPTLTARAGHGVLLPPERGLVMAIRAHSVALPAESTTIPTIAAAGNHVGLLLEPAAQQLALPFLTDYHGTGVARAVSEPHRTMDTNDRYNLTLPAVKVEDCRFRMLGPLEVGRAMAFPETYTVLGNKRQQVRQFGNAVTPPAMELILRRAIASLAPSAQASSLGEEAA